MRLFLEAVAMAALFGLAFWSLSMIGVDVYPRVVAVKANERAACVGREFRKAQGANVCDLPGALK